MGTGKGEPLALRTLNPGGGGIGAGRGEPLALRTVSPGGGGMGAGRGEPLRRALEAAVARLLDKCLTELLTGSTIENANMRKARRIEILFIMVESLLVQP